MTHSPVSTRPGPAPASTGQWWCAGLGVAFAVWAGLYAGVPSDGPSRNVVDRPPTSYSAPPVGSGHYQSENYNYPNVNGPNVRWSGAGKAALRRALR